MAAFTCTFTDKSCRTKVRKGATRAVRAAKVELPVSVQLRAVRAALADGRNAPFAAIRGIATEPLRFNRSRAWARNIHPSVRGPRQVRALRGYSSVYNLHDTLSVLTEFPPCIGVRSF